MASFTCLDEEEKFCVNIFLSPGHLRSMVSEIRRTGQIEPQPPPAPRVPSLVKLPFREEEKTVSLSVMTEKHIAFTPIPFHRGKNNSRDHKIINPKAILQPSSSVSPKMCPQNPSMHCAVNGCQGRDPIVKFGVKEAQMAFFTSGFLSISDASMCARSPQDPERMQVITCARPPHTR